MELAVEGAGGAYAAPGVPDAETAHIKAHLATVIADSIAARKLTQKQASRILGIAQPKLSHLLNGRFHGISEAKMLDCLVRLGRDVRIVIGRERLSGRESGTLEVLRED